MTAFKSESIFLKREYNCTKHCSIIKQTSND